MSFESLESMRKRLNGCGSCEQVIAVQKSVSAINEARGVLDRQNSAAALFALAVALGGCEEYAYGIIRYLNDTMMSDI